MSVELVSIAPHVDRPIRSPTVRKRQQRVPYLDVRTTRHAAMTARETLQHTQRLIVYWSPYEPNIAAMLAGAAIDGLVADAEIRRAGTAWGPGSASPSSSQAQKSRPLRRCRQGDPVLAEPPPASGGASGVPCSAQLRSARQGRLAFTHWKSPLRLESRAEAHGNRYRVSGFEPTSYRNLGSRSTRRMLEMVDVSRQVPDVRRSRTRCADEPRCGPFPPDRHKLDPPLPRAGWPRLPVCRRGAR